MHFERSKETLISRLLSCDTICPLLDLQLNTKLKMPGTKITGFPLYFFNHKNKKQQQNVHSLASLSVVAKFWGINFWPETLFPEVRLKNSSVNILISKTNSSFPQDLYMLSADAPAVSKKTSYCRAVK